MPAYIQSKVFAYKGWHPPNFRIYVPPKVVKDAEKEDQQPEPGEIIEEPKADDNATVPRNSNLEPPSDGEQAMDLDGDMHFDEDTIQEQLLPCSLEPVEMEEAVVEPDTNEELPSLGSVDVTMDEEGIDRTRDAEAAPLGDEKIDEGNEADVEVKEGLVEAKIEEQVSTTDKTELAKKKPKPKKKKSPSEEGYQSLGDKVS
jgi:endoribonuclease Dicer